MAAPTATAETVGRPIPPPPAPEIAAKVSHFPPPFPPQPDAPAPKRRKLEEAGFHTSAYYKIRAAVADLRLRFVQQYLKERIRDTDLIQRKFHFQEIKTVMELSKKMRLDLGVSSESMKPSEKPLAGAVKDEPTEPIPSAERNQVPPTAPKGLGRSQSIEVSIRAFDFEFDWGPGYSLGSMVIRCLPSPLSCLPRGFTPVVLGWVPLSNNIYPENQICEGSRMVYHLKARGHVCYRACPLGGTRPCIVGGTTDDHGPHRSNKPCWNARLHVA
uniref:Uncharacterized protein n=1 Tax=Aegilops tauschii TaxID=37682 RepID=M8CYH7_AEGTA